MKGSTRKVVKEDPSISAVTRCDLRDKQELKSTRYPLLRLFNLRQNVQMSLIQIFIQAWHEHVLRKFSCPALGSAAGVSEDTHFPLQKRSSLTYS